MNRSLIAMLACLLLLTACGQKGPLYLPQGGPAAEQGEEEETDGATS